MDKYRFMFIWTHLGSHCKLSLRSGTRGILQNKRQVITISLIFVSIHLMPKWYRSHFSQCLNTIVWRCRMRDILKPWCSNCFWTNICLKFNLSWLWKNTKANGMINVNDHSLFVNSWATFILAHSIVVLFLLFVITQSIWVGSKLWCSAMVQAAQPVCLSSTSIKTTKRLLL